MRTFSMSQYANLTDLYQDKADYWESMAKCLAEIASMRDLSGSCPEGLLQETDEHITEGAG